MDEGVKNIVCRRKGRVLGKETQKWERGRRREKRERRERKWDGNPNDFQIPGTIFPTRVFHEIPLHLYLNLFDLDTIVVNFCSLQRDVNFWVRETNRAKDMLLLGEQVNWCWQGNTTLRMRGNRREKSLQKREGDHRRLKCQERQWERAWGSRGQLGDNGYFPDTPLTLCPASLLFHPQKPISCSSMLHREIIKEI